MHPTFNHTPLLLPRNINRLRRGLTSGSYINKAMLPPECKLRADTENKSAPGTPLSAKLNRAAGPRLEEKGEGDIKERVRKETLLADERCAA